MKHFRDLSQHQERVLGCIAIGQDQFHNPATIKVLIDKGLIVAQEKTIYGKGNSVFDKIPMKIMRYEVPLPVHFEWCEYCASIPDTEFPEEVSL